jgi:hypothetical protein
MRRKLQRMSKNRTLFLDETALRLNEAPTSTVVLPGETAYVIVEDTTAYAKRYDMIACVNANKTFAPVIYSPAERSEAGVKGISTEMLVDYVYNTLGQETAALDDPPLTLVVDRARIHNEERVLDAFNERGGHNCHVTQLLKMPTQAAKRLSPLDNSLFHEWKERVRKRAPITSNNIEQLMADEWNNITPDQLRAHFYHCGLLRRQDPYKDCTNPAAHAHGS